ncbi:NAD-dependent epimerase/dehydratase family protein [Pengzhenrongella frigida]|uniref:NAD-dependent epimerase/dehydratase family protein n=1 Tax=Pengzhenrongella frigida TaxID=1259133 RepID=A0A4Q5MYH7_9MICO|nr:NAD-dependent epimerase/dehydratase family protein [Cellulomonas sp. HLT2-17]RYV50719.1 NAD-dependent epimerase/dehydratase family protein [Cellulomonas sp. HLT2-17]
MRVAVVGASGNVGTALLRRFADDATVTSVVGIVRRPPPAAVVAARDLPAPYDVARWVGCDLAAQESDDAVVHRLAAAFAGADAVVHLAWAHRPSHDRAGLHRANVHGARRVADAAVLAGVPHLVVASAGAAYSPADDDEPRTESWPTGGHPDSAFSADKVAVEGALDDVERLHPGLVVTRVRSGWVAQRAAGRQVMDTYVGRLGALTRLVPGRPVPLPRGLRLQAVHADDLAAAYREIVVRRHGGAFNIAAPDLVREDDIAALVGTARVRDLPPGLVRAAVETAWRARIAPAPGSWIGLARSVPVLDTARARRLLSWTPLHSSASAVAELVAGMIGADGTASPPLRPGRGVPPR